MSSDVTSTYSMIGRGASVATVTADMTPVVQGLARLEVLLANLEHEEVHVTVPVPSVVIENKPMEHPVIEVHCPEPVVHVTVPETIIPAPVVHVTVPQPLVTIEPHAIHVTMPSLKVLVVANVVTLIAVVATAVLQCLHRLGVL